MGEEQKTPSTEAEGIDLGEGLNYFTDLLCA